MSESNGGTSFNTEVMSSDTGCEGRSSDTEPIEKDEPSDGEWEEKGEERIMEGGRCGNPCQNSFTSEIYKIEIRNIPSYVGFQQMRKKLNTLNLKPVKVKLLPRQNYCFVTFKNEEDRQSALGAINGLVWKKKTLKAHYSKPAKDPILKKRKANEETLQETLTTKRFCEDAPSLKDIDERLIEVVTPLWKMPYSEQLELKTNNMKLYLQKAASAIKRTKPGAWFDDHLEKNDGLLCPLLPIQPSPRQDGYRNKCEFTIGYDSNNQPVIGFRLGSYQDGDVTVAPPHSCINVPDWTKGLVKVLDAHIKKSLFIPFNVHDFTGHWKQVLVRYFTSCQSIVIVQFHAQDLPQEEVTHEKHKLTELLKNSEYCPTSLYWQTLTKERNKKPPYEHLLGDEHIYENILGLKFRVSPDAFFQVNTQASEVLYKSIAGLCTSDSKPLTTIYDVCCGTGTIGIIITNKAGFTAKLIGIELSKQAIEDAIYNAESNGITDARFISGRAEEVLPTLVTESFNGEEVIGIVDPPRSGLHQKVIQAIRRSNITRLIYVSCNPEGTLTNFTDLCRLKSNRIKGLPFRPVSAIPVDMFPHTPHCELITLFQRLTPNELEESRIPSTIATDDKGTIETEEESVQVPIDTTETL